VAINTGEGWLLHAGDAYFFRGEVGRPQRECPPGMRFYQWMMEVDRTARLSNQERLRRLSLEQDDVRIFCAHDVSELRQFTRVPPVASF
jgi:glyoxylase-like metal-dependent hydrolase (beta-lactamase superfamily II)